MVVRAAINGFGRIGRLACRVALENPQVEVVAINGRASAATHAHLLKYDSTHGQLKATVSAAEDCLIIDGREVKVFCEQDPANLPWGSLGVDVVIESSGQYRNAQEAQAHRKAGAKKVIISAPAKNEDITIVLGVNEEQYQPENHHIISNASCTTNCMAPAIQVVHEAFGIVKGMMTTVHSYTNDQRILDKTHKDLRRARSAGVSIIPTTTGAAKAVSLVLPEMEGKLTGFSMRVPTPDVSVVDLVLELARPTTVEELNAVLKEAAETKLQGIMGYCELPLVSIDYRGDARSSTVDALSTMVIGGNMVKLVLWYDNEWGYSNRLIDLVQYLGERL